MSIRYLSTVAALCAALLLGSSPAAACTLERSELGGWIGDCNLSKFFEDLDIELLPVDPHPLSFPNLRVREIDTQTWGDEIEILVEVANGGWSDAPAFDVAGVTHIVRMDDGAIVGQLPFRHRVAGLAAGTASRAYAVTAKAPDQDYTYDFVTTATVDPLSSSSPVYGEVDETSETDNTRTWSCRVLGGLPGQAIPAAHNCFF